MKLQIHGTILFSHHQPYHLHDNHRVVPQPDILFHKFIPAAIFKLSFNPINRSAAFPEIQQNH
jgi:hypothetical protein